jgi:hypothetical protein
MKKHFALIFCGTCLLGGCGSSAPPTPPALVIAPASLSFGVVVVGATSSSQVETLTNNGGSELVINGVATAGANATDFEQSSTCGSSLGAAASCTLNVTFTPSQLGPRSASIMITDDALIGSQAFSLTGVGGDSGPNATFSPTNLSFGNEDVNTTSAVQSITLSNYGTTTLSITSIAASTDFGQTNTCNSSLASGANCTINVTFTPSQTGSLTGTLSVADSAADSPQMVALSGTCGTAQCRTQGEQCYAGHSCCPGLVCVAEGNRAYCVSGDSENSSRASSLWDRVNASK